MKICIIILFLIYFPFNILGQPHLFPNVSILNDDGSRVPANSIKSEGHPMLVVFWNLCNGDCQRQVEALAGIRDDYLKEFGVKLVGIYVTENGNWSSVVPFVNGKAWNMELFIDVNSELARTMSVPGLPYTQLYGSEMDLICSHIGFCAGIDDLLCEKVKECLSSAK